MLNLIKDLQNSTGLPIKLLLLISLSAHLISAYFNVGFSSPDEHYQIIEFANYKLGNTPAGDLHWEFHNQLRPAAQPALAFIIFKFFDLFGIDNPFFKAFFLRLISSFISFFTSIVILLFCSKKISNRRLRKWFVFLTLFLWFTTYLHGRFSSEIWSGSFFFVGLILFLSAEDGYFKRGKMFIILLSGMILGFGFWFRFQIAFSLFAAGLWIIFINKSGFKPAFYLLSGFLFSVILNTLIDIWFYGMITFTPYQYYYANIVLDKASNFGVSPFYYYLPEFISRVVPFISPVILVLVIISIVRFPKNVFVLSFLFFVVGHSLVAHKEFRFLYPMVFIVPYLTVIAIDDFKLKPYLRMRNILRGWKENFIIGVLTFENIVLLIIMLFMPASETVSFFEKLYSFPVGNQIKIYTLNVNPYQNNLGRPNFYINKNITFQKLNSFKELDSVIKITETETYFFNNSFSIPDSLKMLGLVAEAKIINIPGFLKNFNYFGWQERSHIWTLYRIDRIKKY